MAGRVPERDAMCAECYEIKKNATSPKVYCYDPQIQIDDIVGRRRRSDKKTIINGFLQKVNGMLNGVGGIICIHASDPSFVGLFDEQVNVKMCNMISDGSLFHENFERHVLPDNKHVVFRILKRKRRLSNFAVNSKMSLDVGLQDMTQEQTFYWLKVASSPFSHSNSFGEERAPNEELAIFKKNLTVKLKSGGVFQESASVQAKRIRADLDCTIPNLTTYIWKEKALATYISAFSKLPHGGSIYFGLWEEKQEGHRKWRLVNAQTVNHIVVKASGWKLWEDAAETHEIYMVTNGTHPSEILHGDGDKKWQIIEGEEEQTLPIQVRRDPHNWKIWRDNKNTGVFHVAKDSDVPVVKEKKTGRFIVEGVRLSPEERHDLRRELYQKITDEMLWICRTTEPLRSPVSINYPLVENDDDDENLCVVEVSVKRFHGFAFYDCGPLSYYFHGEAEPERKLQEWKAWIRRCDGDSESLSAKMPEF